MCASFHNAVLQKVNKLDYILFQCVFYCETSDLEKTVLNLFSFHYFVSITEDILNCNENDSDFLLDINMY